MFDILISNAQIIDGSGNSAYNGFLGINGDKISFIDKSPPPDTSAIKTINASGLTVAPGFINMLSWAAETLYEDGRSMSELFQGVTLEVFGEGFSFGPMSPAFKNELKKSNDFRIEEEWSSFEEFMNLLENHQISCNIASFVGSVNPRALVIGFDNQPATESELDQMKKIVDTAMNDGAMGLGSALIYPPDTYSSSSELTAMAKVISKYNGTYTFHMRSEGESIEDAIDEVITIAKEAHINVHIHHLKLSGKDNWHKYERVMEKIEKSQREGVNITANMYTYPAGATGLSSCIPSAYHSGGQDSLIKNLQNPELRKQIKAEMNKRSTKWENLYLEGPDNIVPVSFVNKDLEKYSGKTISEIAKIEGKGPEDTIIDLLIEDTSRIGTIYHIMNEELLEKQVKHPWVTFCSDEGSYSPNCRDYGKLIHPRAYGSFSRVIGLYVNEKKLFSIEEAIRKLSSLPASVLGLTNRGLLRKDYYADIVIFKQNEVKDLATYEKPHVLSTGMKYVTVNGVLVIQDGEHTGKFPGKFIKKGS